MADSIATLLELKERLDWELDEGEERVATGALEDLSEDARFYGSDYWDSVASPRQVKSLVLRAAARYMRNFEGYVQSRAGDETIIWTDDGSEAGTAHFNRREQKILAELSGRVTGLTSVGVIAYGSGRRQKPRYIDPFRQDLNEGVGYAPTQNGEAPVPFFVDGDLG